MRRLMIWAAIDIRAGKCVRLHQGDFRRESVYGDDPVAMAKRWVEEGADGLHIIDLDGAETGRQVNWTVVEKIREAVDVPIQSGGGLRTLAAVQRATAVGVRPIVSTRALVEEEFLADAVRIAVELVVAVDVSGDQVRVSGWQESLGVKIVDVADRIRSSGVSTVLVTDVMRDGTLTGINEELIESVCERGLSVIAAGGVAGIEDVEKVAGIAGVAGVVIGKALYEGKINLGVVKRVVCGDM